MSHKTSAARRAAFFAALRETGNQTIAAERAQLYTAAAFAAMAADAIWETMREAGAAHRTPLRTRRYFN